MICPVFPVLDLVVLVLCLCSMAWLIGFDWKALAVAIVVPSMLIASANLDVRPMSRPQMRRQDCYWLDRGRVPK